MERECLNCGKKDENLMIGADGEYYCKSCFEEEFGRCTNCGEVFRWDDLEEGADGYYYCEECFSRFFGYCYSCDRIYDIEELRDSPNGYQYCNECFSDRFGECAGCGEYFEWGSLYYREEDDCYYCESCYDENSAIRDYSYKPKPIFFKASWENTIYMGVELEVEGSRDLAQVFLDKFNHNGRFYLKHDGSIDEGFEIVTHPHTLKEHKKIKWKEILSWLDRNGFSSYDNGRCGLHIHVNRNKFSRVEISKLLWFFYRCGFYVVRFSQRNESQINEWAKLWCPESIEKYETAEIAYNSNRYKAINLQSRNTIEFRVFRGTLYYPRFLATLQFVDSLCGFIKQYSPVFFKLSTRLRIWTEFKKYSKREGYHHLVTYLTSKNL